MHRRHLSFSLLGTLLAGPSWAQAPALVEGKHFLALGQPLAPAADGKIEVLEFFSYACPACNAFDPMLDTWAARLPADVSFRRVPVPFLYNAENFQRTFFALQATGGMATVHRKVFDAVHVEKKRLDKFDDIADVVAKAGGDREKFATAFKSFSMAAFLAKAKSLTAGYQIEQIPSLGIAGRYVTSPSKAGGALQALAAADQLVQRVRKG